MKHAAFLLAILACFAGRLAWGTVTVRSIGGEVWLGNRLVLRAYPPAIGKLVAGRIRNLLRRGANPASIRIQRYGRSYSLNMSSLPIILATPFRARLNHTSPRSLAFQWAGRLRSALLHGTYLITPSSLVIPYGETRALSITGRYPGTLSVEIENQKVSNLVSNQIPLLFKGENPGSTKVSISVGNLSAFTNIIVKRWAGVVPDKVMLSVTGAEVPRAFLEQAITGLLQREIQLMPGSELFFQMPGSRLPLSLSSGQNMIFPVKTRVRGEGYLTVNQTLQMQIQDQPFSASPPAYLAVSNNPENFVGPGKLFEEDLPPGVPVRIFFHHHNMGNQPFRLIVSVTNTASTPAAIHVLQGTAGPDSDEIQVGETAAYHFFFSLQDELGELVTVNPGETYRLASVRIPPRESFSGMALLTPLSPPSKGALQLQTEVEPLTASSVAAPSQNRMEKAKPRGIFAKPEITINANYAAGGHYAFVDIGKDDFLKDAETGNPDYGDYGVVYSVNFTLSNPLPTEQKVAINFVPQGGQAAGVFLVDGQILQIPPTFPFTPYPLFKTTLKPGETRMVTLKTIPAGGSFYPVELVAKP